MADKTALLVIDVQTAMFAEDEKPHEHERLLGNVRSLIDRARAAGSPVIYVRHEHATYPAMMRGAAYRLSTTGHRRYALTHRAR